MKDKRTDPELPQSITRENLLNAVERIDREWVAANSIAGKERIYVCVKGG